MIKIEADPWKVYSDEEFKKIIKDNEAEEVTFSRFNFRRVREYEFTGIFKQIVFEDCEFGDATIDVKNVDYFIFRGCLVVSTLHFRQSKKKRVKLDVSYTSLEFRDCMINFLYILKIQLDSLEISKCTIKSLLMNGNDCMYFKESDGEIKIKNSVFREIEIDFNPKFLPDKIKLDRADSQMFAAILPGIPQSFI